jgi:hypothetical protein
MSWHRLRVAASPASVVSNKASDNYPAGDADIGIDGRACKRKRRSGERPLRHRYFVPPLQQSKPYSRR